MLDGADPATRPADRHGDIPAHRRRRFDGPGPPARRARGTRSMPPISDVLRAAVHRARRRRACGPRATRCSRRSRRPRPASRAAIDAQRALDRHAWPDDVDGPGPDGPALGRGPPRRRRLRRVRRQPRGPVAAVGHGGQIVLSGPTRALVESSLPPDVRVRSLGPGHAQGRPAARAAVPARRPGPAHGLPAAARGRRRRSATCRSASRASSAATRTSSSSARSWTRPGSSP